MEEKKPLPELSVVVPVLNEAALLADLFRTLADQQGISLELVVSDGGSTDGTNGVARLLGNEVPFPVTVTTGKSGRGRQLNSGATASSGATLLFLHADSRFTDPQALATALDLMGKATSLKGNERIAGHFSLRFARRDPSPSLAFFYYESKARLDRRECTHGDQGFMLRRAFFTEAGPFDESLSMLAETRFAETVRRNGEWLLFPGEIFTSARRFETEGLYARQALNAIIMNFAALGWETFFCELASIYSCQDQSGQIALAPMLRNIGRLIAALPLRQRLLLWYATGAYVHSHAWQIPFFFDTRRNFRRGIPPGEGKHSFLNFHDHYLNRLTDHIPGRLAAASLTWLWFRLTSYYSFVKERNSDDRTAFERS